MLFNISYLLLWALVVTQALVIFVLARQLTYMREIAATGSTKDNHLPIGSRAPSFSGLDVRTGKALSSADFYGKKTAICFLSAGCGICRTVARDLARQREKDYAGLIVHCSGPGEFCKEYLRVLPGAIPLLTNEQEDLAHTFGADAFPVLVMMDESWAVAGYRYPMRGMEIRDALSDAAHGAFSDAPHANVSLG